MSKNVLHLAACLFALAVFAACTKDAAYQLPSPKQPPIVLPPGTPGFSPCAVRTERPLSETPAALSAYAAAQFPGWKLDAYRQYRENGQIIFLSLEIEKGLDEIDILFTPSGQYISHGPDQADDKPIPLSALPQGIKDYIKNNFPGHKLDSAEEELEYGQFFYEVELDGSGPSADLYVYFDGALKFVCSKPDKD